MNLDALVFAAHPDDAELGMGGTIANIAKSNFTVGLIDITQGEMSTRGSLDIRKKESNAAADILKTSIRENLLISDGDIQLSDENIRKVVVVIRKYIPKVIFAPYFNDRHPDHISASNLVKKAFFVSGLEKYETSFEGERQAAYRPEKLFYYMQTYSFSPSFIIDISNSFDEKLNSVKAFATQFHDPDSDEPDTFISQPEFIDYVEARAKYYGFHIGKKYGEPFYCEEHIELDISQIFSA
ncbi:MAG: bacillithiol biosynthesis deacetylase BshB1 [Ignavibacterium sp.]|nr:MAG: bacillithiol biosynthesis deacetylase BshB1 [Ignavibacterium sp.]